MVQAKTILICLAFGLLLDSLNAPLPFLFGSLFGCLAASLTGIKLAGMPMVSSISRTVLGVAIGTTLTMEVITSIPDYFLTLLMVPLYVLLISSASPKNCVSTMGAMVIRISERVAWTSDNVLGLPPASIPNTTMSCKPPGIDE